MISLFNNFITVNFLDTSSDILSTHSSFNCEIVIIKIIMMMMMMMMMMIMMMMIRIIKIIIIMMICFVYFLHLCLPSFCLIGFKFGSTETLGLASNKAYEHSTEDIFHSENKLKCVLDARKSTIERKYKINWKWFMISARGKFRKHSRSVRVAGSGK